MSGQHGDGYRRGRQVEQEREPRVGSVYRRLLLIIWGLGAVILLVVPAFGVGWTGIFAVVLVMHGFFAGLIFLDIRSLRQQGVEWGYSRHLWFSSALVFPFVTLVYCWYVARVVRRENERRGYTDDGAAEDDSGSDDEAAETTGATETTDR
jgi:membrane-bound ClpP family serine protease